MKESHEKDIHFRIIIINNKEKKLMYYEKIIKCPHKVQLRKFYFELYHFFLEKGILETIKKNCSKKKL
jgi:hypothetical protein